MWRHLNTCNLETNETLTGSSANSENSTTLHWSIAQSTCSRANGRRAGRWTGVDFRQVAGLCAFSPPSTSLLLTVHRVTFTPLTSWSCYPSLQTTVNRRIVVYGGQKSWVYNGTGKGMVRALNDRVCIFDINNRLSCSVHIYTNCSVCTYTCTCTSNWLPPKVNSNR